MAQVQEKPVTCALALILPTEQVLLVHPTGNGPTWSLPKGMKDLEETPRAAALREAWEETGLDLRHRIDLRDHGRYAYVIEKDFHLFSIRHFGTVDCKTLSCASTFTQLGKPTPEVDNYVLAKFDQAVKLLNKRQAKIFASVIHNL